MSRFIHISRIKISVDMDAWFIRQSYLQVSDIAYILLKSYSYVATSNWEIFFHINISQVKILVKFQMHLHNLKIMYYKIV